MKFLASSAESNPSSAAKSSSLIALNCNSKSLIASLVFPIAAFLSVYKIVEATSANSSPTISPLRAAFSLFSCACCNLLLAITLLMWFSAVNLLAKSTVLFIFSLSAETSPNLKRELAPAPKTPTIAPTNPSDHPSFEP